MNDIEKLQKQLFVGKVADIIGFERTIELLQECKDELQVLVQTKADINLTEEV